jgi:hypothetical protein
MQGILILIGIQCVSYMSSDEVQWKPYESLELDTYIGRMKTSKLVYIGRMKTSKLVFVCLKIKDDVMKEMIRSWSKRRIYKLKKNWNWNCVVGSWIFIKSWNI